MIGIYADLLVASSIAIALVLIVRPLVIKYAGARNAYVAWWAPVLAMACTAIPAPAVAGAIAGVQRLASWKVSASGAIADAGAANASWLMAFILLPAVVRILLEVVRYRKWMRRVEEALVEPDAATRSAWACFRSCSLWRSPHVDGPLATGIFSPRVYLPMDFASRYSPSQQRMILAHEQVHIQRRDSLANALAFGMRWLFWFNPLMHQAYRRFRQDQELACDAVVLEGFHEQSNRRDYADALVRSASRENRLAIDISLHPVRQQLEERLIMLAKHRSCSRKTRIACVVALAVTTATVGSTSAFGTSKPATDSDTSDVTLVHHEPPRYPVEAAKQGIEGHVTVKFRVLGDGSVDNIQVLDSQPPGVFDEVTVAAAAQWLFAERASPRQVTRTFEFALDK